MIDTDDNQTINWTACPPVASHYAAVASPTCFEVSGNRWVGSMTPDAFRDLWQTPRWLFNYFSRKVGGFDVDAAANSLNALCDVYWTEADDCLSLDWPTKAKIWLNPPYSDPLPFVEKAIEQSQINGCVVYLLIPDDISTLWFRRAFEGAAEAYGLVHNGRVKKEGGRSGRVSFVNALTGEEAKANNKGSWVFVIRPHRSPLKVSFIDRDAIEAEGASFF